MWADAIANAHVISTDATGALIQPAKTAANGVAQACKKGHFFTAVVDCDAILFAYVEHHSSDSVNAAYRTALQRTDTLKRRLFGNKTERSRRKGATSRRGQ
jgi:hypothetical protein